MPRTTKSVSKLTLTEKRLAANRANAAHSTGPRTPEGKARSSLNAVQHGFRAAAFTVIRLEDLQEIDRLNADLVSVYCPVNAQEMFALHRMAIAQQAILRTYRLEAGLCASAMNEFCDGRGNLALEMNAQFVGDGDIEIAQEQNRNFAFAEGFQRMVARSNVWTLFLRYQAQAERTYRRALEEFERLKALRPEFEQRPATRTSQVLPNEPTRVAQVQGREELRPIPAPNSHPNPKRSEPPARGPYGSATVIGPEGACPPASAQFPNAPVPPVSGQR